MFSTVYHQRYQELKQALEQLQNTVAPSQIEGTRLRQMVLEVQQFFQQQIIGAEDGLSEAGKAQVRSYQTEMSKQLQLLQMDVAFLQAARQPQTAEARQTQLQGRLQILIGYCEALLQTPPPAPQVDNPS